MGESTMTEPAAVIVSEQGRNLKKKWRGRTFKLNRIIYSERIDKISLHIRNF